MLIIVMIVSKFNVLYCLQFVASVLLNITKDTGHLLTAHNLYIYASIKMYSKGIITKKD